MTDSGASITLAFEGLAIRAHCGLRAHRDWLVEFLVPDFAEVSSDGADCTVEVRVDGALHARALGTECLDDAPLFDCFALDSSVVRLPILSRAGSATTVVDAPFESIYTIEPETRRVTILTHPGNGRVRASLLRVVREFAMNALHDRGLFLHASAIEAGGAGLAFAGHKAAGKTTLLTYLLGLGVGTYVSNDRIFVSDRDERPLLRNVPTVISVRPGTLDWCSGFRDALLGSRFATYLSTLAEVDRSASNEARTNEFGNYFLSPAQFRSLLGVAQSTCAPAAAVVFPVIDGATDGFSLRRLTIGDAMNRVGEALLGSGSWRKGPDAFTIPVDRPSPSDETLAARARRFFESVPCFELRLGSKAYEDGSLAQAVIRLTTSRA